MNFQGLQGWNRYFRPSQQPSWLNRNVNHPPSPLAGQRLWQGKSFLPHLSNWMPQSSGNQIRLSDPVPFTRLDPVNQPSGPMFFHENPPGQ